MATAPQSRRSLDAALVKGVAWTSAASWVTQGLTWASTLLVVRILSPDDYGLVALAAVYLGLASLWCEFGFGTTVVTIRGLSPSQMAQLNAVALLFATVALGVSWLIAGTISHFFDSPRLTAVIRVMSTTLVLAAVGNVSSALLQKGLRFRFLATAQVVQSLVAAATTLVLALLGRGYWALAVGPLAGHAVMNAMIVIRQPIGYAWPVWASLGPVLRFSRQVIIERFAWYAYTGADRLVVGKLLGEVPLGHYSIASDFGMMAVEKVAVLMLRVAPAVFSEVQADAAALRRYFLSMTEGVALVTFPISVGFALVAEDLVMALFGVRWHGAAAPLQLLALFGAFQSVAALLTRVLAAVDEMRFAKNVALAVLGVMPLAFILGTRWGLAGVAAAWVTVFPFTQVPLYLRLHQRIQLTAWSYLRALWPAVSAVVLMTTAIGLLRLWPAFEALPRAAHLALTAAVGAIAYSGAIVLLHSGRIRLFRDFIAGIRAPREAPREVPAGQH